MDYLPVSDRQQGFWMAFFYFSAFLKKLIISVLEFVVYIFITWIFQGYTPLLLQMSITSVINIPL